MKKILAILAALSVIGGMTQAMASVERVTAVPADSHKKAPIEYVFQLESSPDKFILLDDTEDGFYVLSYSYYTRRSFDPDGISPFDPEDENNIGWWLNNTFLTDDTLSKKLPKEIKDNILEHTYVTEGMGSSYEPHADFKTTCKVVLLSQTEWLKYNGKFGYADDESYPYWYLRTTRGSTGNPLVACQNAPNTGITGDGKPDGSSAIRPAFYLPHDFFNNVKLNLSNTGDIVLAASRKYSQETMQSAMYSAPQMVTLLASSIAPQAENLAVVGRAIVGEAIQGSYKYVSADNLPEDGTRIQWVRGDTTQGPWTTIVGANELVYIPTKNDIGCYLAMQVSPANSNTSGATYISPAMSKPVRDVSLPTAQKICIIGNATAGNRLEAVYHYSDENYDTCSSTIYQWQTSKDNRNFENIQGATKRYYTPTGNDCEKYIRVSVTPRKCANTIVGVTSYSESVLVDNLPELMDAVIGGVNVSLNIVKQDEKVTVSGMINSITSEIGQKIKGNVSIEGGNSYTLEYIWQISDERNGYFEDIKVTGTPEYVLEGDAVGKWLRLCVRAYNAYGTFGTAVYSNPVFVGGEYSGDALGNAENSVNISVQKDKQYLVFIQNSSTPLSYAYSFEVSGSGFEVASDDYITNVSDIGGGYLVTGTKTGNKFSHYARFQACVITAKENGTLTIRNAKAAGTDLTGNTISVSAKIDVSEKQ